MFRRRRGKPGLRFQVKKQEKKFSAGSQAKQSRTQEQTHKGLGRIKFCDKDLRLKIFYRLERRQKVILAHGTRQSAQCAWQCNHDEQMI